jgi:hypothetical protein
MAASVIGVGGGMALALTNQCVRMHSDALLIGACLWLLAWAGVRFSLDLNGITSDFYIKNKRNTEYQYSSDRSRLNLFDGKIPSDGRF